MRLSVVVPCFNEPLNVGPLVEAFEALMRESSVDMELILIDGGSSDETPERLSQLVLARKELPIRLIAMKERKGYGHDIVHALLQARGEVLAWTHADLQTDPRDVLRAYELYQSSGAEVFVKGARRARPALDALFTFGMQVAVWVLLGVYLRDINAQPKLFSRGFFERHLKEGAPLDFSLDLYAMYKAKTHGVPILSFGVDFSKRRSGEAKGGGGSFRNRLKLIRRTFSYILNLRRGGL